MSGNEFQINRKTWSFASIYTPLDKLNQKGFVIKSRGRTVKRTGRQEQVLLQGEYGRLQGFAGRSRSAGKVLGASIGSILSLTAREFPVLVCLSDLIALPVAYFLMNGWLKDFTYRFHSIRAASSDPVKSLRFE